MAKKVASVSGFLAVVHTLTESWGDQVSHAMPWFRGHSDAKWELIPRLYRKEFGDIDEDDYRSDFQNKALPYLPSHRPQTQWGWYSVMQHYGLATRLIDWSESSLIALYFAVRNAPKGKADAAVWMLDPWKLNEVFHRFPYLFDATDADIARYVPTPFRRRRLPKNPIAIDPPYDSRRIAAQRGTFTIHGNNKTALESLPKLKPRCVKIIIDNAGIKQIKHELWSSGVRETTLFPELSAVCRELEDFWLT